MKKVKTPMATNNPIAVRGDPLITEVLVSVESGKHTTLIASLTPTQAVLLAGQLYNAAFAARDLCRNCLKE